MSTVVLSPQEMRARLVASYLDSYRRAGIPHTVKGIERQVVADCELVDAARRAGELTGGGKRARASSAPKRRRETLEDVVAREGKGARLADGAGKVVRSKTLHANPQRMSERWAAAVARLKRILEGAAKANTLAGATTGAEYRPLAMAYAETWALYMARVPFGHQCGVGCNGSVRLGNPFCRLPDGEADALLRRKVEDICDRSTGVLGSWYVR